MRAIDLRQPDEDAKRRRLPKPARDAWEKIHIVERPGHVVVSDVVCGGNLVVHSSGEAHVRNVVIGGNFVVTNGASPVVTPDVAKTIEDLDGQATALVANAGERARALVKHSRVAALWSRPNAAYLTILLFIAGLLIAPAILKFTLFAAALVAAVMWWRGTRRHQADNAAKVLAELDKIDDEASAALKALEA